MAGYEEMKRNKGTKWLSDDRGNGTLLPADEAWAKTVWFPEVQRAGWKHWAMVLPQKVVAQMNIQRITDDYKATGIEVRVFSDPESAMQWLEGV